MKTIDISKLNSKKSLYEIKKEVDALLQQNLTDITEKSKTSFIIPLNLQSIICLFAAYTYKIPIITTTALYQLYANDLIVIVLTLLRSKNIEDEFLGNCKLIYDKLSDKQVDTTPKIESFYSLLKHNIYEHKIYVPADLW